MGFLGSMWNDLFNVFKALLLLIAAFIVASIVRSLVLKLIEKTRLNMLLFKADGNTSPPGTTREYIGKLIYFIVFLLFVPGIFDLIGANSVTAPIITFLNQVWGYVPNILAAIIILVVGLLIARLVRQLLVPVFARLRVDKLQEKAGIEVTDSAKLSTTLAYIAYVLIVIPVVIMALEALKIETVSAPAIGMLNVIFSFIPNIIIGILIITIGVMIGKFAGQIVERLIAATGVDEKLSSQMEGSAARFVLSRTTGIIIQIVVVIFFAVEGFSVLKLGILTDIGTSVISYMPRALGAVVLFAVAMLASSLAARILRKNGWDGFVLPVRGAIYVIAAFMILNQLGIAAVIVNSAFILLFAAVAVAFAIAFGIGGKDFAKDCLKKLEEKKDHKE
ncbi:MAG: mechanosensitive ion channel [Lachnospiraceae bacterium]|nr:mechanosensitive ion channel [Lachnospiraceae bacterium]